MVNINKMGYVRVASAIPNVHIGNPMKNAYEIVSILENAAVDDKVNFVVFPELSVCGYTCNDLLMNRHIIKESENAIKFINSHNINIVYIIGAPVNINNSLYNCAVVCYGGKVIGIVPKTYLPNYNEFYEMRHFSSAMSLYNCPVQNITYAGDNVSVNPFNIFNVNINNDIEFTFGVEICEDVWSPNPPSTKLALSGAEIVFNLSTTNELIGKHDYLLELIKQQSARLNCAYVYSSSGFGESSSDLVFAGNAIIYENGRLLNKSERFSLDKQLIISDVDIDAIKNERIENKTFNSAICNIYNKDVVISKIFLNNRYSMDTDMFYRHINNTPFVPKNEKDYIKRCEEIINIQTHALMRRIDAVKPKKMTIGVSGGADSTLALLVAVNACDKLKIDRKHILGITMPCFGTTARTKNNSILLMESLGIDSRTIDITKAVEQHFSDIGQATDNYDITYENCQARERTQVLMDVANKEGGFVLGTGSLSEIAQGWCTYNADHMSMYNVNCSVPKTLGRFLIKYFADYVFADDKKVQETLYDILNTPISPELLPPDANGNISQMSENSVGPYVLVDFFLYNMIRHNYSPSKIFFLAIKAFENTENEYHYSVDEIYKWIRKFYWRFFANQFKRNCVPDGPKIGSISLSPRGDWRMPADMKADSFIAEIEDFYKEYNRKRI